MGWLLCQWSVIPTCHLVTTVFADTEAVPEPVDLIALVDRVGCEADEFPSEASMLRLGSAVLSEISEEWETRKIYLSTEDMPA